MAGTRGWLSASEERSREIASELAAHWEANAVVLLYGEMGSGKTVFAQGVAAGLGLSPREIQSPTFTIVREHETPRGRLVHLDLYRLEPEDLDVMAIDELLDGPGIKLVEWADRLPPRLQTGVGYRFAALADGRHEIVEIDPAEPAGGFSG